MTEAEWRTSTDAGARFAYLAGLRAGLQAEYGFTGRKLRLFLAAGSCPSLPSWPTCSFCGSEDHELSSRYGEVLLRYADGKATASELGKRRRELLFQRVDPPWWWRLEAGVVTMTLEDERLYLAHDERTDEGAWEAAVCHARHCRHAWIPDLIRDLRENPFAPPRPVDHALLSSENGLVVDMAQSLYEERAFDRLPILGDALEEAGCTDTSLLDHLRGPGLHVRGCWALDLLPGKK